jgi:ABC-type uncharacterized transport system ATPase component
MGSNRAAISSNVAFRLRPPYQMFASNRKVVLYSTDQRMILQAPNMDMGKRLSLRLLEVSVGQRQLVSLLIQVLMQHVRNGY